MPHRDDTLTTGLRADITRRDFINGALVGSGLALLCPHASAATTTPAASAWTGFGGVGDYANSNGNTEAVTTAAHKIRDGAYAREPDEVAELDEAYDLIIVGGGLAGLHAAYEVMRTRGQALKCLILDNHPVFGGEAKQNEFLVDGHRLYGPQGSNDFLVPTQGYTRTIWSELGLPDTFEFATPAKGTPAAPLDNFGPMYWQANRAPVGYFFRDPRRAPEGRWVVDPWKDGFARAPIPTAVRRDLLKLWNLKDPPRPESDFTMWLDGMTYKHFLVEVLGLDARVTQYVDPLIASADYGFGSDVISAYAAYYTWMPGVRAYLPSVHLEAPTSPALMSFPGGNSGIARALVKRMLPDAIKGPASLAGILEGPIQFSALDREGSWLRIRLGATAVDVRHEGELGSADFVAVTYARDNRLYRVRGRSVVMASGGWVNRRVLRDMPERLATALAEFHHGPMLVANVALRHWRFLDKLGFTSARWFEGFGFFANIRRPMVVGGRSAPFHPDQPIVMTFYVPLPKPGHDIRTQEILARNELYSKSYRDYEIEIRKHMSELFGAAGFDAARDIAGIILNRWGHAYIAPQPGFLLGRDGKPSPLQIVREGYGRIFFGHSECAGAQNWPNAAQEGSRAARQALSVL